MEPRTLMACSHSTFDPASRFRVMQWIPYLTEAGWSVSHRPNQPPRPWGSRFRLKPLKRLHQRWGKWMRRRHRLEDVRDAANFDLVFLNRDLLAGEVVWERRMIRRNARLIFDFDDAIFLGGKKRAHIEWICRNAAWVTAGNEHLAEFARRVTSNVTVLPTVVDVERYAVRDYEAETPEPGGGIVRLGWLGSPLSIRETLFPFLELFASLQKEIGFEFVIVSKPKPKPPETGLIWRFVEWSPTVETEIERHFDIGVMPLVDNDFQKGKCGLKLLQSMAAGLPVIASPVGLNRTLTGRGGLVAETEREWGEAIRALAADPRLRRNLGLSGRDFCGQNYSLKKWLPVLLELFDTVSATRG